MPQISPSNQKNNTDIKCYLSLPNINSKSITYISNIKKQLWCGVLCLSANEFSSKQMLKSWLTMSSHCTFTKVTLGLIVDLSFRNSNYLSDSFGRFESYFWVCYWDRLIKSSYVIMDLCNIIQLASGIKWIIAGDEANNTDVSLVKN